MFVGEASIVLVGCFFFLVLTSIPRSQRLLPPMALYSGMLIPFLVLAWVRQKSRPWKLEYDACNYEQSRAERALHPIRFKYKRSFYRILLWAPSALAAFVLFFFPVASHLAYLSSSYVKGYDIHIPWTFSVLPGTTQPRSIAVLADTSRTGQLGVTPFWRQNPHISTMTFESGNSNWNVEDANRESVTYNLSGTFSLGNTTLSCWKSVRPHFDGYWERLGPGPFWIVNCGSMEFHAFFDGREEDIPAFYNILEHARAVQ